MKAVRAIKEGSAPPRVKVEDIPRPSIKSGQLLVRVHASSVQPADILNSTGGFGNTTFPRTLGKDFAGIVEEGSSAWRGRKVYGTSGSTFSFTEDGGQAEYAVVREEALSEMPSDITFAQAASVGTPYTTGLTTLRRSHTQASDTVMVLGATGSVGSSVVQMAKSRGCKVITVGRHGTDINSTEDPQLAKAKELTGGKGPDVIIDTVGDFSLTSAAFQVLAFRGRLATITAPRHGSTELAIDVKAFYRNESVFVGCNTAASSQAEMAECLKEMKLLFESGKLLAPDEKTLNKIPVHQAVDAYNGKVKRAVIVFD